MWYQFIKNVVVLWCEKVVFIGLLNFQLNYEIICDVIGGEYVYICILKIRIFFFFGVVLVCKFCDYLFGLLIFFYKLSSIIVQKFINQGQVKVLFVFFMWCEIYVVEYCCQVWVFRYFYFFYYWFGIILNVGSFCYII